jgi:nitrous oxidase accessory protein
MRERQTSLTLLLILCFAVVSIVKIGPVKAESSIIVVPDDYWSIQEAVNNASEGDTIFVKNGIYYEHVVINKSICLIGENRDTTVIDGNGFFDHVIEIDASNITIANLTIQKALGDQPLVTHGINIGRDSSNIVISNNTIKDNSGSGIYHERRWGLSQFSNHTIVGNNMLGNVGSAVLLRRSDNNTIAYNNIENGQGIYLDRSSNNTVNGNSINGTVSHNGIDINEGTRNLIFRNNITNTYFGVSQGGSNNTISENIITNSQNGIVLHGTDYCTINGNNVTGNYIGFSINSMYNIVLENNIKDNHFGVVLWVGSTSPATDNIFFHNNFVNNTQQVLFEGSQTEGNFWDNGSEGNCWSDYNGADSDGDGIGDTPYVIDENNRDNCPLIESVIVPESSALIILPIFVALSVAVKIYRKNQKKAEH